nr:probable arginine--tRNA ligase, mitochondrial [Nomia melanderi]
MSRIRVKYFNSDKMYYFEVPLKPKNCNETVKIENIVKTDMEQIFNEIKIKDSTAYFSISRNQYIKTILENNFSGPSPPLLGDNNKNVIVEFSSPNIAKPFHLGHLRSTVTGNYVANINSFLQNRVKKINYLGDWGTQYGYIQQGIELGNIDSNEMKTNPIKSLYKAYVIANELAKTDSRITDRAREIFNQLEYGNANSKEWQTFKDYTVQELEKTYKRIGVSFEEYHWESTYTASNISTLIKSMEATKLLMLDEENRKVIPISEIKNIPLIKSDGSTLYIVRDIAAAIDRFEKNKFDVMYYVVDNAQHNHFTNLVQILKRMEIPWADKLVHVKFGRVRGMSTRKGTAVFLEDILDEAKEIMRERQINSGTTKVSLDEMNSISDILGISSIIIYNLCRKRGKDYEFDWDTMLDMKGDSGIKMQYTHCRLSNLEHNSSARLIKECDASLLKEPEVDEIIVLISRFDEIILQSYQDLEPCVLVVYLYRLSKAVNTALISLNIKNESADVGNQRLLLFHVSKLVIAKIMKLLGLMPLEKM